jgi:hypothetical protein
MISKHKRWLKSLCSIIESLLNQYKCRHDIICIKIYEKPVSSWKIDLLYLFTCPLGTRNVHILNSTDRPLGQIALATRYQHLRIQQMHNWYVPMVWCAGMQGRKPCGRSSPRKLAFEVRVDRSFFFTAWIPISNLGLWFHGSNSAMILIPIWIGWIHDSHTILSRIKS